MKNVIKKLVATAMAFTLLGTGTAVTKTIAPQFDNSITANAVCKHVVNSTSWSKWKTVEEKDDHGFPIRTVIYNQERTCKCAKCHKIISTQKRQCKTLYYFFGFPGIYTSYSYI